MNSVGGIKNIIVQEGKEAEFEKLFFEMLEHIKKDEVWIQTFFESGVGKRLAITDKLLTEREEMTPCIFYALISYDLVKPALESTKGNLAHSIKQSLDPFCESMGISKRDKDKLIKMFTSQPRFLSIEDEKAEQNAFFKKKDFFYDAFMVFKIIAISKQDDVALQSAFFWEISLRQRPVRDFSNKNHNHNHNHSTSPNPNNQPSQNKKPFKQGRGRRPPHNRNANDSRNTDNSNSSGEDTNTSSSKEE